ncbi:cytochrome C oxidase subunit III [Candidatus Magnetoovum chiemensis]|nr:cytochrome C oxidase subunit III [Candidatus Magnetoovum chiemensis]
MENVMEHGGGHGHAHEHEVELSVWPLIVALGGFLVPVSFMLAFSWNIQFGGLFIAGIAVVLLLVGLFGWTSEVYSHKKDVGLSKVAIIIFILSEFALFGGLFGGYLYNMLPADVWPPSNTPHGIPPLSLALLLTVFLISSSGTIHVAEDKLHNGNMGGFSAWLGFTIVLGLAFILGMAYEWAHLFSENFTISSNAYGTFFFTITGLHGSHVVIGLVMQLFCIIIASKGQFTKEKNTLAKATGLYWHFVDGIWLLVLSLMYVIPYFKVGY